MGWWAVGADWTVRDADGRPRGAPYASRSWRSGEWVCVLAVFLAGFVSGAVVGCALGKWVL